MAILCVNISQKIVCIETGLDALTKAWWKHNIIYVYKMKAWSSHHGSVARTPQMMWTASEVATQSPPLEPFFMPDNPSAGVSIVGI